MSICKPVVVGKDGVAKVTFANDKPLAFMAGTCALESRDITMKTAETLKELSERLGFGLVYKGSFDKANRTSASGKRGMGLEEGLKLLAEVRAQFGVPVLTDVHEQAQVAAVAEVVDVIQIPAFLSRQTDLLVACGEAAVKHPGLAVNIKKGQFMAPQDMLPAAAKVASTGSEAILLTERGATFGYGNLVVDMRSFPIMAGSGYPVIHDASHCVMMPSVRGDSSGGDRSFIPPLARAAVAVGVAGLFIETHPDPANAFSDKETQVPLAEMEHLLHQLLQLDVVAKTQIALPTAG
ncbi:MAG: 3-deoxy-8-phosphooctulonate synthase [Pseudomonadaceae bacterium]|nr:3-deoxy-8-phosphooctulonate synthase [Pseudomonadaceae bacterium]